MNYLAKTLALGALLVSLSACNQNKQEKRTSECNVPVQEEIDLVGRQATIEYPDFKADMTYMSDSVLHWKTTNSQNMVEDGTEKFTYKKIEKNIFFLNWIEKDGTTVSQVIDYDRKKVFVYLSYSDASEGRGGRNANFIEGKFQLKED